MSFCVFLHVTTWFLRFLVVIICDFISTIEILRFIWTCVCCPIEAWASRLGLDESVVRCALPWQQQFPATSDGRCCLFNSVATPMLIAILAKGAYGAGKCHGGCSDETDREKMHALLAGLLMLLPKTCILSLRIDEHAVWIPGVGMGGRNLLELPIQEMRIEVQPLLSAVEANGDSNLGAVQRTLRSTTQTSRMPLWLFIKDATQNEQKFPWLWRQIVLLLALALDHVLQNTIVDCDAGSSLPIVATQNIVGMSPRNQVSELQRYMKKGVETFGREQFLSMAPDAAKCGHKSLFSSPLAGADSKMTMWCPPQDLML